MGKLMGSRRLPSPRGERTDRTRQLNRLRLFFAPRIDREGEYDVADEFGLRGDDRFSPDDLGRLRCARRHTVLRYLPGALPIQRQWRVLLLPSRLPRRISRDGQCRRNVGLRRDRQKNNGSNMGLSEPRRCCGRRSYRMQRAEWRRDLPRRQLQCLRQDTRRSARHLVRPRASITDALSVN
jgi:hypothetical protein